MKRKPRAKPVDLTGTDFDKVLKKMLQTPPPTPRTAKKKSK